MAPSWPMEIERKWLVRDPPEEALRTSGEAILQGYLAIAADGSEVRLRRRGRRCSLTVKSGEGMARAEVEIELNDEQFGVLWPMTQTRRLEKTRRLLDGGGEGVMIELDQYSGELDGLLVAEVEFESEAAARRFCAPAWFGPEVTDEVAFRNRCLAVDGPPRNLGLR